MNTEYKDGRYVEAVPLPYYWGLIPFLWKYLTGWRDSYGRGPAFIGFKEGGLIGWLL